MTLRMKSLFFACLLGALLAIFPGTALAEKVDWKDDTYDFSRVRRILVFDIDTSAANIDSQMVEKKLQSEYMQYAGKTKCSLITYEEARRIISEKIGNDLAAMEMTDPGRAGAIFIERLPEVADVWVKGTVKRWEDDYHIVPERTVWEEKRVNRPYRDRDGKWHDDYTYITVPVTYPAHRVDVSYIKIEFEVCDAATGKLVMGREDNRDREGKNVQDGMYERICKSFFGDLGGRIHKEA